MKSRLSNGTEIKAPPSDLASQVLTPETLEFLHSLHKEFHSRRQDLLQKRNEKQQLLNQGALPDFPKASAKIRSDPLWKAAPCPKDLECRWVEITGPTDRKMVINALNSGADVFMADFEDANSPTWTNLLEGQLNLTEAIAGTLAYTSPEGKSYALKHPHAVLLVRPRGWHLNEKHLTFHQEEISGSLFDFGLFFYRNARALLAKGTGPYFYLPKLESSEEAKLWNDVFIFAQQALGIPRGTIRATVLIETISAAFEMEEILYELKEHASGLNAGRWDYIFSIIKKFRRLPSLHLPDREQVTMTAPFMRAYTELLIQTCHKRGAHAMGGMAAFIPDRKDPAVTEQALRKVREDKLREVSTGFDGTWVAHPDLVPIARKIFETALKEKPHQKGHLKEEATITAKQLLNFHIPNGTITEAGLRRNIEVAIRYLYAWYSGRGAAAIHHLMEDVATAEISRAQVWQWIHNKETLEDGRIISLRLVDAWIQEESRKIEASEEGRLDRGLFDQAIATFRELAAADHFVEFLTLPAYQKLQ